MAKRKSEELADQVALKRTEIENIFKEYRPGGTKDGQAMPDEIIKDVKARTEEVKQLGSRLGNEQELERIEADNTKELEALNAPVQTVPHPGSKLKPGESRVEGFSPAGATVVDSKDLSVVYEEGDLGIDQKTFEAISSIDYKRAFRSYLRKKESQISSAEMKVLQEGSDAAGGFLVPDDVLATIVQRKPTPTKLGGRVTRLQTSRDAISMAKVNYTADDIYTTGIRVTWTGEKPSSSTQHRATDPSIGQIRIPVHTAMLSLGLTLDQIEDSAFPLVSWVSGKFQETLDILDDDMIANGDGIGKPAGLLFNPGGTDQPDIVKTGDANLITADGIQDLAFALPEQYDENAAFFFNKTSTGKAIAKLKDSDNRYIYGMGLQDSGLAPSIRNRQLLGYDSIWSALFPNVAANAFPIVFGDLTGYYLVRRVGFSIQVIREKYAEDNMLVLLGRVRLGGQVAEPFKMK
ncbi:MAG: phage major capsid protein, partial [Pyrinomonadaceae bacterium]